MFDILTNETNLNPLRAAIANAEREILICSAWVRSSGNGTPGNGGLLLRKEGSLKDFLYSLTLVTQRLLGKRYRSNMDIFDWWSYKGKTLREMCEGEKYSGPSTQN